MLAKFATHTRQSTAEREDTCTLAKKWLALQCNLAPAPHVYAHIAHDYPLLELRTHEPPITTYATGRMPIDEKTFVWVTSHLPSVYTMERQGEALSHFVDTFFPRPIGEEAWVKHKNNQDGWKPAAYFLALNCRDNAKFYSLVEAIHGAGASAAGTTTDKSAAADLFSQLKHYKPLEGSVSAKELGELISLVDISPEAIECGVCDGGGSAAPVADTEPPQEEEEVPDESPLAQQAEIHRPLRTWAELRRDPLLQEYRRVASLPPTYPVEKLAESLLVSAFAIEDRPGGPELVRDARALMAMGSK